MGIEFKMNGEWFPETPETFAELQSLARGEPEIWEAICDPRQNDWHCFLRQVEECGEANRVRLLEQIYHDSPNACSGLLMRILKADEAELRSEELKDEIKKHQAEEELVQRVKEETERYKAFEDALRNGSCLETGICRTITLLGDVTMEMIYCPPGEFMMGSPASEGERSESETLHRVQLTRGFWLGKYEVTQLQWQGVMQYNPSSHKGDARPVISLSWGECQEFIRRVRFCHYCARLPTEAEWEYACRAGTSTVYSWGNSLNGDMANCSGDHPYGTKIMGRYLGGTTSVGTYGANPWGFYDMHGNIPEWCNDWYGKYCCEDELVVDPKGPATGEYRVTRGGGYNYSASACRSASRMGVRPDCRWFGFRLCCSAGLC